MARNPDTIAALATPAGTSALALLRLSGPAASAVGAAALGGDLPPRHATHRDYLDLAGTVLDDVVATRAVGPHSYTGEDTLEIACHGSPYIVRRILADLLARGCRPAGPGEFTQRAFLNGRMDLSQAEAVMDLIHARGEKALQAAQRQLRGALGKRMQGLITPLLRLAATVEAAIDFPEEDIPPEDAAAAIAVIENAICEIRALAATRREGDLLRQGMTAVIVGEPNAGKSSLLNRLVGSERALVSPEPGTTRDYIEESITASGYGIRLIDTAGLNPSPAGIESLGMARSLERAADADLLVLVLDASRPASGIPPALGPLLRPESTLAVLNKADLLLEPVAARPPAGFASVTVSALTGAGIERLKEALGDYARRLAPQTEEDGVVVNARHARSLDEALMCGQSALAKFRNGEPSELIASDLRGLLDALGEISGRIDHERVLDVLFATFCIGK